MPDLEQNRAVWETGWDWSSEGEEWSEWWGGTPALWHAGILPRIHAFLPAPTILEIAPGFGRWTEYLRRHCDRLIAVDLAERCVESCRRRFAEADHLEFHVNDGRSLPMVADRSVDLAFSFDSLVHVEADVLEAYLGELARTLAPDGVAFLHHSNAGAQPRATALARRTPERLRRRLVARGAMLDVYAWRATSVTAEGVADAAGRAGLACIAQEKISWEHGRWLTDALTLLTPRGSRHERPRRVVRNPGFGAEGRRTAALYAAAGARRAAAGGP